MRVRRGGLFHRGEWRGRRVRWLAGIVLLGALAEPAAAYPFRGDSAGPSRSRSDLLLLQSSSGSGALELRDLLLGITSQLLPEGNSPGFDAYRHLTQSFHRSGPAPGFFRTTSPGPAPAVTSVPEPGTLVLVFAGLAAAAALARRR